MPFLCSQTQQNLHDFSCFFSSPITDASWLLQHIIWDILWILQADYALPSRRDRNAAQDLLLSCYHHYHKPTVLNHSMKKMSFLFTRSILILGQFPLTSLLTSVNLGKFPFSWWIFWKAIFLARGEKNQNKLTCNSAFLTSVKQFGITSK